MEYRHLTTNASNYNGIQMQLTLELGHSASARTLLGALEGFADTARGYILQRLSGDWVIRVSSYERLSFDLRGPHGCKFSLRIPRGARPIRPEDFALLVAELKGLIREGT